MINNSDMVCWSMSDILASTMPIDNIRNIIMDIQSNAAIKKLTQFRDTINVWFDFNITTLERHQQLINKIKHLQSYTNIYIGVILERHSYDIFKRYYIDFVQNILVNEQHVDDEFIQTLFFVGKKLVYKGNSSIDVMQRILVNPIIDLILSDSELSYKSVEYQYQYQIQNSICTINVLEIMNLLSIQPNYKNILECVISMVQKVHGYFLVIDIKNLPFLSNDELTELYYNLSVTLGTITKSCPVNGKYEQNAFSRDIKYTPGIKSYYASNIRQPLHTDFAYYPTGLSKDWLLLYSLQVSEYGGITSILHTRTLLDILQKYYLEMYYKIHTVVKYVYKLENGENIIHSKYLCDNNGNMNWNINQISDDNEPGIKDLCTDFKTFLETFIVGGQIYDFSKKWQRGDCVIFNDHLNLHCRSAFLGDRWLKDFSVIDPKLKL